MTSRRPVCPRCLRPQATCLCALVRPVANEVELLLLQHPLEQHEAKGTARLLQLSLARCRVEVGERFDVSVLGEGPSFLLYPAVPGEAVLNAAETGSGPLRLVVLDATWRKSRKLLHLNPWLLRLPRLALTNLPPSRYAIRKAQEAHQLSTLEASLLALQQLEGRSDVYAPLWAAFDGFVAQTLACRPGATPDGLARFPQTEARFDSLVDRGNGPNLGPSQPADPTRKPS